MKQTDINFEAGRFIDALFDPKTRLQIERAHRENKLKNWKRFILNSNINPSSSLHRSPGRAIHEWSFKAFLAVKSSIRQTVSHAWGSELNKDATDIKAKISSNESVDKVEHQRPFESTINDSVWAIRFYCAHHEIFQESASRRGKSIDRKLSYQPFSCDAPWVLTNPSNGDWGSRTDSIYLWHRQKMWRMCEVFSRAICCWLERRNAGEDVRRNSRFPCTPAWAIEGGDEKLFRIWRKQIRSFPSLQDFSSFPRRKQINHTWLSCGMIFTQGRSLSSRWWKQFPCQWNKKARKSSSQPFRLFVKEWIKQLLSLSH